MDPILVLPDPKLLGSPRMLDQCQTLGTYATRRQIEGVYWMAE